MPEVTAGSTPGYLAVPAGSGPWPGVVVIHELFGLNADIQAHADRLAPVVKLVRLDFRPESAADAWQRIFRFFGEYLH